MGLWDDHMGEDCVLKQPINFGQGLQDPLRLCARVLWFSLFHPAVAFLRQHQHDSSASLPPSLLGFLGSRFGRSEGLRMVDVE